tara:strand:- start:46 stop:258 length:213 start_codon:yes stop_codon:yes gene_type:complete
LGFNSTEEETFFVVEVEPDLAFVPGDFARGVFLTVAVAPSLEAEEARFEVFLAIDVSFYQKSNLITNATL